MPYYRSTITSSFFVISMIDYQYTILIHIVHLNIDNSIQSTYLLRQSLFGIVG